MDWLEQFYIHGSVLHLFLRLDQGFPEECRGERRVTFFFVDHSQPVKSVGHIGLREHKFVENFLGVVKLAGVNQIESLIPPFDVVLFLEWPDLRVLFSDICDIFRDIYGSTHMHKVLNSGHFIKYLERFDGKIAQAAKAEMCRYCGGKLHCGDYARKPRGVVGWDKRHSFNCARCRRRKTPPSVRFLGRRVYAGVVVALVSALMHGLNAGRAQVLVEKLGIDRRTLKRWLAWWRAVFVTSGFWKGARASFMPQVEATRMPLSLLEAFGAERRRGMFKLLLFIAPITTGSCEMAVVM